MKKLFFALITSFWFVTTAWGQCTGVISSSEYELDDLDYKEFTISEDIYKKIKFQAKKEGNWAGSTTYALLAYVYDVDGNEIGTKRIENDDLSKSSWKDFEIVSNNNKYIRKIKFQFGTIAGGLGTKLFRNVEGVKDTKLIIPTDDVNFGSIEESNTLNKSINIDFSALESALTASVGTSNFVLNTTTIAKADCSHGTATLNITFKPTAVGAYSDVITFSNGTKVNVYGECSKRVCTNLEVAKISYTSVLLRWNEVVDADLSGFQIINQATGAIYYADKDDTSLNVTGLEMGKSYSFVIFPLLNGVRSLCASNIVIITTNKTDKIKECLVYTSVGKDNNEQNLIASDAIDDLISYDIKSGNSNSLRYTKRVTFEAKWRNWALIEPSMGARGDMCMYVKVEGESGFREEKYWSAANVSLTKEYQKFSALIPHNTVAIEFRTGLSNGASYRYVRNLEVYKDFILETPISKLDFGMVEPNVSVTRTFDITYAHDVVLSEIAYDNAMKTIIGDGLGFYKVEYADNDDCAEGTQTVTVTFTPTNCAKEYNATLTLINGAVLEIPLKGKLERNPGTVSEITWTGAEDTNWDNRNNWVKEDGTVLSAADVLSENLVVTLPAGKDKYPTLPDVSTEENFKTVRDNACKCSQVNAGDNATATEIAHKIYMEYGASLVGVENLNKGTSRYTEVEVDFKADRNDWLLVGPIVKPWDDNAHTRSVVSGDYYLNGLPHVYMHEAVIEDGVVTWNKSFSDLTVALPHDKVFAIRIPDQYGTKRFPAVVYNRRNDTNYDPTESQIFHFKGRFYNENDLPRYADLTPFKPIFLNNTYPANINAYMLQTMGYGTIQYYDYTQKSFIPVGDNTDAVVSSHHGFIFTPATNVTELVVPQECMLNTEVTRRQTEDYIYSLRLQLMNVNVSASSEISVVYDELKEDVADYALDAPKVFNNMEANLADLYVMRYNSKWAGLTIPKEESLPLGVRVRTANQTYKFNLLDSSLFFDVILEDRQEGKEYNLTAGEVCEISDLEVGECVGRFYLKTTNASQDDDVPTDIYETEENFSSIDIYSQGNTVTVSSSCDIRNIFISDLSGRQMSYNVSGRYIVLDLPVSSGIYTINVIGNSLVRTEKIRLN